MRKVPDQGDAHGASGLVASICNRAIAGVHDKAAAPVVEAVDEIERWFSASRTLATGPARLRE